MNPQKQVWTCPLSSSVCNTVNMHNTCVQISDLQKSKNSTINSEILYYV